MALERDVRPVWQPSLNLQPGSFCVALEAIRRRAISKSIHADLLVEIEAIVHAENRSIDEVVETWLAYYHMTLHFHP